MSYITSLEKKFGLFAIQNLTLILIVGQAMCYIANAFAQADGRADVLSRIEMVPDLVAQGEVWRLVTYLFDPPRTNLIFAFFGWYLFYLMGTTLESNWGAFRYNVFLLIGYLASISVAFLGWSVLNLGGQYATNAFLYGTVFLAFARLYPDFTIMLFFILPVKIKWLALFTWVGYGWTFLASPWWLSRLMVIAAVLNYLLFFGRDIVFDMKHGHRRMQRHAKTIHSPAKIIHECQTCGLTSTDAPRTAFRYCSECAGQCCYCPDHLISHEHVVRETA